MNDQRGGIISKIFIIPVGVVVIIGVFALGYYTGKEQAGKTASSEKPAALPEVVSQYLPRKEDFTFYKTLTEKGEKTVSIDLKPKPKGDDPAPAKKEGAAPSDDAKQKQQEAPKVLEVKPDRPSAVKQLAAKPQVQQAKKEPPSSSKVRYTIQVGSYPERAMAEDAMKTMKKRGYAAFVVATAIPEKGTWYRVRVGSFANKQSAEKLSKELKSKEGVEGFVTTE